MSENINCPFCCEEIKSTAQKCKHCGEWIDQNNNHSHIYNNDDLTIARIADYEKVARVCWLILAILQIVSMAGIIAGVWNIIAVYSRWSLPDKILNRDQDIPAIYEPLSGLITIGVINLICGGVIGLIFVGLDFYVRDQIIKNSHLFNKEVSYTPLAA